MLYEMPPDVFEKKNKKRPFCILFPLISVFRALPRIPVNLRIHRYAPYSSYSPCPRDAPYSRYFLHSPLCSVFQLFPASPTISRILAVPRVPRYARHSRYYLYPLLCPVFPLFPVSLAMPRIPVISRITRPAPYSRYFTCPPLCSVLRIPVIPCIPRCVPHSR